MTSVAEEAPAVADEDAPDPVSGIALSDEAEILMAQAIVFRVCSNAASRTLALELPGAEQRVKDAETAEAKAREALTGPEALAQRLRDELAECLRQGEEIKLASEDDDLKTRINARSLRVAYEQEAETLEERVRIAARMADPLHMEVITAERELKTARAALASLQEAVARPFFHPLGRGTVAHARYLIDTGMWFRDTASPDARALLTAALRSSGLGAEVEKRAIESYISGNPAARAIGDTRYFPDGTKLITSEGRPPVVVPGGATPDGLAAAPVVPLAPAPSAAQVMSGFRSGAGWPA